MTPPPRRPGTLYRSTGERAAAVPRASRHSSAASKRPSSYAEGDNTAKRDNRLEPEPAPSDSNTHRGKNTDGSTGSTPRRWRCRPRRLRARCRPRHRCQRRGPAAAHPLTPIPARSAAPTTKPRPGCRKRFPGVIHTSCSLDCGASDFGSTPHVLHSTTTTSAANSARQVGAVRCCRGLALPEARRLFAPSASG